LQPPSVATLSRYFLTLGAFGFGGPVALVARMRRDLVEQRSWISESDFRDGVALAQVAPGPLAAQLAMYLGWLRGGAWGAVAVGFAFVIPSLLIVLLLAELYQQTDGMPLLGKLFYGVGAAVIAVIARSGVRLARTTIRRDPILWLIVAVNAVATVVLQRESIPLVFASGIGMVLIRSRDALRTMPARSIAIMIPVIAVPLGTSLPSLFLFFASAGLVVFGSGLAIVPFLHGGVVLERHWLTEQQFLDAVAVSLLTPGPVVITVAFIGSLVAGSIGGIVAAAGVFLPTYLVVVLVAPHFRRLNERAAVQAFSNGVTSAAIGALLGAVGVMALRALVDVPTMAIAVGSLALLVVRPRTPEPLVLVLAAAAGVALHGRT
jgi:chromate transporter